MAANSALRRAVKATLRPLLNDTTYSYLQGVAQALDIVRGKWYEPELDLISLAVSPGDDVLDLGANYGLYTYHLSRAVGARGRVYAFEPVPFTHRTLAVVVRLLGLRNVTIVPKGCSDAGGTVTFRLPVQASGAPGAGQAHIGTRNDERPGADTQVRWDRTVLVQCEMVALDEYLPPLAKLSLIKCDIEGAELLAFRGAMRVIDQHRPCVICEINPWFLDGFGLRLEELVGFFSDRGYRLYRYASERRLAAISSLADVVEDNYVFIHPDRLAPFAPLLEPR
jgi:FkbM family methyltransferase